MKEIKRYTANTCPFSCFLTRNRNVSNRQIQTTVPPQQQQVQVQEMEQRKKCRQQGVIESLGATPQERENLFWHVCIPYRLAISLIPLIFMQGAYSRNQHDQVIVWAMITLSISLASLVTNAISIANNPSCPPWWDRRAHFFTTFAAVVASCLVMALAWPPWTLAVPLFVDIVSGLYMAMTRDPFKN